MISGCKVTNTLRLFEARHVYALWQQVRLTIFSSLFRLLSNVVSVLGVVFVLAAKLGKCPREPRRDCHFRD